MERFGWTDVWAGVVPVCLLWVRLLLFGRQELVPLVLLGSAGLAVAAWGGFWVVAGCANVDNLSPVLLLGPLLAPVTLGLSACYLHGGWPVGAAAVISLVLHLRLLGSSRPPQSTPEEQRASRWNRFRAQMFGALSAIRAARTFHPDGTLLEGTAAACDHGRYPAISKNLAGGVLVRCGSGIAKRRARRPWPRFNAPNLAVRFTDPQTGDHVDILALSIGTNFWTALWELLPFQFKANPYDYFRNTYNAWVPYHTPDSGPDVHTQIRAMTSSQCSPRDFAGREKALRKAVKDREAIFVVEIRRVGEDDQWTAVVEFTLSRVLGRRDQEPIQFHPFGRGRGFEPYGRLTDARRVVYPASVAARPGSRAERVRRAKLSCGQRFALYLNGAPPVPAFDAGSRERSKTAGPSN